MSKYLMGIDNGGTFTKAVIFDVKGCEIASASGQTPVFTPKAGYTERDMEQLWQLNCRVITETIAKSGVPPEEIIGVSFSGHGKGIYLWGKDEKPAYNGIISTDGRAYEYPKRWEADGTAARVFTKTFQNILACQPVSLLCWFKDHHPEVLENTRWIFGVKDYIRYRLTGEAYGEITDFSGSNLVNLQKADYDLELLKEFGLEELYHKLPPLRASTEMCGVITPSAAELTGLRAGTPVAAGMFDIDACAIAMDITDQENLCVIAGTWGINEYISRRPVLDKSVMMNSLYCIPGYYLIEESSPTSAANNEWFCNMFMGEEKVQAEKLGMNVYQFADKMVESVAPDEQNIIFLPYIFGSNYNSKAKAAFIGMDSHHSKAHIVRAVFEGIVFCHMVHIEKLLKNRKHTRAVRLAGGAANSEVWVQIFADVLNLPIEIINVKELGALGAAMAAGVACGEYPDLKSAAEKMVSVKYTAYPNKKNADVYRRKFELYKRISGLLDSSWDKF